VFKLMPGTDGKWTETVLHVFHTDDGSHPQGGLAFDAAGNLYGTTSVGGGHLYFGEVFELTPRPDGKWKLHILHSFSSENGDGAYPSGTLVLDADGNVYGTAYAGGGGPCYAGCGIAFRLKPRGGRRWHESI